eukprot:Colp12_sorted_trinity150504_noHs@32104
MVRDATGRDHGAVLRLQEEGPGGVDGGHRGQGHRDRVQQGTVQQQRARRDTGCGGAARAHFGDALEQREVAGVLLRLVLQLRGREHLHGGELDQQALHEGVLTQTRTGDAVHVTVRVLRGQHTQRQARQALAHRHREGLAHCGGEQGPAVEQDRLARVKQALQEGLVVLLALHGLRRAAHAAAGVGHHHAGEVRDNHAAHSGGEGEVAVLAGTKRAALLLHFALRSALGHQRLVRGHLSELLGKKLHEPDVRGIDAGGQHTGQGARRGGDHCQQRLAQRGHGLSLGTGHERGDGAHESTANADERWVIQQEHFLHHLQQRYFHLRNNHRQVHRRQTSVTFNE